ncbi:MAG: hypothetical protein UR28_C0010G0060 [Candidatus Peregrinibacteria bacterium GW2011_GWF2_33_10]|nr:MAG: hypothetical protein UR28_C0010G0060 [Candidatus Peregrinibacteria bacterium GW2011_GWF2_33_10]OGJ46093.1 MAG: hypothetical protein A2272_05195 [Candidatus Peregrinibacteria bacterium RIFOXYA12_FULL_33_12]OGJ46202.1 MAG: hypothetical protein A2263_04930 [Candidatus Peregrinibacteria bacterium RIFOXYA2_FULL_33_21]OGJ51618.1 MAG: hypothetical protein A2307_04100 [Candidatus Peregrinibacteria bacterium RIFOXYB2_FULL_33_20]
MGFKKILAIIIALIFIFIFFLSNLSLALFDTYFNQSFYDNNLTDFVYLESREIFINALKLNNADISQYFTDSLLEASLDKFYQKKDIQKIIDDLIMDIKTYQPGKNIMISFQQLKLDFENIIDELSQSSTNNISKQADIVGMDFYEYFPNQFNFSANFSRSFIVNMQVFLNYRLLAKIMINSLLVLFIGLFCWLIHPECLMKIRACSLLLMANVFLNLGFLYLVIGKMKMFFTQNFPLKTVNSIPTDIGDQMYAFLISPLFYQMLKFLLFILILSIILLLVSFYHKKIIKN